MEKVSAHDIAKMIDHSLLNPVMTRDDIAKGCDIAKKYNVASVCVKPCFVEYAGECLKDSDILVTTVIGFPHGSNLTEVKVYEAKLAIEQGCKEIDMVMNIGMFLGGEFDNVEQDIKAVCDLAHVSNVIVKVILENAYLSAEQISTACKICEKAGANFVKTSTGYAPSGATLDDLKIMRASVSDKVSIKAAGGVRSLDGLLKVRAVGAIRSGATATVAIMEEAYRREAEGTLVLPENPEGSLA